MHGTLQETALQVKTQHSTNILFVIYCFAFLVTFECMSVCVFSGYEVSFVPVYYIRYIVNYYQTYMSVR